jgi:hypothetical protein
MAAPRGIATRDAVRQGRATAQKAQRDASKLVGLSQSHIRDARVPSSSSQPRSAPCGQVRLHRRMTVQMGNSSEISGPMYRLAAAGRR